MTDNKIAQMMKAQVEFQEKIGHDLFAMSMDERIEYIRMNVLALTDELHEALNETTWKSWTHGESNINVQAYFNEIIDAWHFLMNLMLVVTDGDPVLTADMLTDNYTEKHQRNITRQETGYDGVSTKCPSCSRELDHVGALLQMSTSPTKYACAYCREPLPVIVIDAVNDVLSSS